MKWPRRKVCEHTHERSLQQVGPPQNLIHGWHGTKLGTFVLDLNNAHKAWEENYGHGASNGLHCSRTLPHFHLIQRLNNKISQWPNLHQQKKCHSTLHKKHQEQQLNHPFCPPQNNRYPLQLQLSKSFFSRKTNESYPHKHTLILSTSKVSKLVVKSIEKQTHKQTLLHKLIPFWHFAETEKWTKLHTNRQQKIKKTKNTKCWKLQDQGKLKAFLCRTWTFLH